MVYDDAHESDVPALEKLAAELAARGFETRTLTSDDWRTSVVVRNPQAPLLAETVLAGSSWYWWPWADWIAPVADASAAADVVVRVSGSS